MLVYGRNTVKEIIKKKIKIKKAYLLKSFNDKDILNYLIKNTKITYLDRRELDKIKEDNQGIILDINDYKYYDLKDIDSEKIVILDHIEDPHNFGAIVRTCEAAGITNIIIPKDRSVKVTSTVMKVSVGTVFDLKIIMCSNLNNAIDYLKEKGYWIFGTDMQGEDYKKQDFSGKIGIVIGNEGQGMSKLTKEKCDFLVSIPMKGTVNSLNASVACGIIIFEAVR